MPLCTLEIPKIRYANLPAVDREQSAVKICNEALDLTLQGLGIPDTEDREWRIVVGEGIETKMSISFTSGGDEYGIGSVFDPPEEQIRTTGEAIQEALLGSPIKVSQITMESWHDSTFAMRPWDGAGKTEGSSYSLKRDSGQPVITLAIPSTRLKGISVRTESEPPGENETFRGTAREILRLVKETLNLPREIEGKVEILPCFGQTDTSVEVDFPDSSGGVFSKQERLRLLGKVENFLDGNKQTGEGTATIWIREGRPYFSVNTGVNKQ